MTELTDTDISSLNGLAHALRLFNELGRASISVSMFCLIATHEGFSVTDYSRRAGIQFNLAGRQIADLSHVDRNGSPGLGFIEKRIGNGREVCCYLTVRGRAFAKRVALAVGSRAA